MVRTQVYLTERERAGLVEMSAVTGKSQSELVREALDRFIEQSSDVRRQAVLDRAAGMWKNREDLPDFDALRRGLDRG